MQIIDSTILAQLAAKELKPFQLLEMVLDGGTYRYTDCDVPIGAQLVKQVITDGPTNHGLCLADGYAYARLNGLDLSPYANTGFLLTLIDSAGKPPQATSARRMRQNWDQGDKFNPDSKQPEEVVIFCRMDRGG
jgi:hypothetical protein